MHHSDADNQSTGPFESMSRRSWQGPEEESYWKEGMPEKEPYQGRKQPDLPTEENMYGPEAQFYRSLEEEPRQTAWRESSVICRAMAACTAASFWGAEFVPAAIPVK